MDFLYRNTEIAQEYQEFYLQETALHHLLKRNQFLLIDLQVFAVDEELSYKCYFPLKEDL